MKKNIGSADKIVRVVAAIIIAILIFTNVITGILGIILSIVAIALILTSIIKICPVYSLLGITTIKKENK